MGEPLLERVERDFPTASRVYGPDHFEVISVITFREGTSGRFFEDTERLYIAALPPQNQRKLADRFSDLPAAINRDLCQYRFFKFFYPAVAPILTAVWREGAGYGQVMGLKQVDIWLQEIGRAQVWYGSSYAVLWECYLHEAGREEVSRFESWEQVLARVWQEVEGTIPPTTLTMAHDPAFDTAWYQAFLQQMGYKPYQKQWWIHRR